MPGTPGERRRKEFPSVHKKAQTKKEGTTNFFPRPLDGFKSDT
jgi:hypothetical protein